MFNKSHTKYIQTLHQKKFRDEYGVFIAETPKVVLELIAGNFFKCVQLFAVNEWLQQHSNLLTANAIEAIEVKDFELEKLSLLATPNKVIAVFKKANAERAVTLKNSITLVLDGIQDPGNFGTIIRTADWFGVATIICSAACADMYNPKVVQSTMGSLARVNIVYADIENWLQKNNTVTIYAAALDGKPVSQLQKITEGIIIIGNEGNGISNAVMALTNERITILKNGAAESLNAAVATGILLAVARL
jgi:RNA methyltransferase, TrmH family